MSTSVLAASVPLYQKAYQIIRADITANRLRPGDVLIEKKLCERLQISRTPLRAALQQLVSDGLATTDSNKSVIVSNVTEEDIEQITVVRETLETLVIRLLADTTEPDGIQRLEELNRHEQELAQKKDYLALVDTDYQFHMALAQMTRNHFLEESIHRIKLASCRFLILSGTMGRYGGTGMEEHAEIIQYLKRGQYAHAEVSMREHIVKIRSRILVYE